ncbi:hypothetical protein [Mucilaginibacter sp.]|uniref:hypothetical protein n=1 Tax=Mucilaginibacter sp. TaxID=1882438 RepID=UPI0035697E53
MIDKVKAMTNQELRDASSLSKLKIDLLTKTISAVDFDSNEIGFFTLFKLSKKNIDTGKLEEFNELINKYIKTEMSFLSSVRAFSELPEDSYDTWIILEIIKIIRPDVDINHITPIINNDRKQRTKLRKIEKFIIDNYIQFREGDLLKNTNEWERVEKESYRSSMEVMFHLST